MHIFHCRIWKFAASDLNVFMICGGGADAESKKETPSASGRYTIFVQNDLVKSFVNEDSTKPGEFFNSTAFSTMIPTSHWQKLSISCKK